MFKSWFYKKITNSGIFSFNIIIKMNPQQQWPLGGINKVKLHTNYKRVQRYINYNIM